MNRSTRHYHTLLLSLVIAASVACSNTDSVLNSENGDGNEAAVSTADVYMTDDPSQPAQKAAAGGAFSGSMTARAQTAISVDGSTWITLGPPATITMRAQSTGDSADVCGRVEVPARTYTRVRLMIENAQATVLAGAMIDGALLDANLTLKVGGADGKVVIEKEVTPFSVRADVHTRIYFDLNTEMWMNAQNRQNATVEDAQVQQSTRAAVRSITRIQVGG